MSTRGARPLAPPPCLRRLPIAFAACLVGFCSAEFEFVATPNDAEWGFGEPRGRLLEALGNATGSQNITHTKTTDDGNYVCGQYTRSCEVAAGILNGPDIWMSSEFTFERDNGYVYKEFGFFNHSSCVKGEPWLTMKYTGTWQSHGLSPYSKDRSLASIDITSVWLTLAHEEVCMPNQFDRTQQVCLDTLVAIKVLCPCNGWAWNIAAGQEKRERNIGMFCRPFDQCPLIHQTFLQQTQYVSYSADDAQGCFSQASSEVATGWKDPKAETTPCLTKAEPMACRVAEAAAFRSIDETWWRCILLWSVLLASHLWTG